MKMIDKIFNFFSQKIIIHIWLLILIVVTFIIVNIEVMVWWITRE